MMKYKAVLFDMDGTLLDTLADMAAAVNRILSVHGDPAEVRLCAACKTRTVEEVRAFVGNGARKLMERALPPDVTGDAFEALLEEYRQWYEAHACVRTAPYPGVPAVLAALHRAGVRCAVVSNKPDGATRELAARFFPGLPAFGQQDGIPAKPAPDMVYHALAELGVEASAAAYVGDSEVDVALARNAGLPLVAVSWGFRGREALEEAGAALVVDDAATLLENML